MVKWTLEAMLNEAAKHSTRSAWAKASYASYIKAHRSGAEFFAECVAHMTPVAGSPGSKNPLWTPEKILAKAREFDTRSQWADESNTSYRIALQNSKLLEQCVEHMDDIMTIWTEESILAEAKKYKSRSDWRSGSLKSYAAAYRRKLLFKQCVKHMIPVKQISREMK
ncbi:hypothetical protein [Vibrio tritonius]|uniref:hypothetical protein n=1 Tax=Vibrio tritonius TaxID=1435069 RepID=UPI00315D523E